MEVAHIIKRDYTTSTFSLEKITSAIEKAMGAIGHGTQKDAQVISMMVYETLLGRKEMDPDYTPTVEQVQDIVEDKLMGSAFHDVAKAYILYRNQQALKRQNNIFEKRVNLKPFEYPQLYEYTNAIRHSY